MSDHTRFTSRGKLQSTPTLKFSLPSPIRTTKSEGSCARSFSMSSIRREEARSGQLNSYHTRGSPKSPTRAAAAAKDPTVSKSTNLSRLRGRETAHAYAVEKWSGGSGGNFQPVFQPAEEPSLHLFAPPVKRYIIGHVLSRSPPNTSRI